MYILIQQLHLWYKKLSISDRLPVSKPMMLRFLDTIFGHRKEHSDGCTKRAKRDDGITRESRIDLQECSDGKPFDETFDETFDEPCDEHLR